MAGSQTTKLAFWHAYALGEGNWNIGYDGNWRRLDALVQAAVKDKDLATPPGSPTNGDCYIVAASPTGAWVGHAGKIARWSSATSAWEFFAALKGWRVHVDDEDSYYKYDGTAWAADNAAAVALETDDTPNGSQTVLNLKSGTNITITDDGVGGITIAATGGGSGVTLETDGVANGSQSLLNLVAGTNITLTDDGVGGVTIAAAGGGGGATDFTDLADVPASYTGHAGKAVRVKSDESGLEFFTEPCDVGGTYNGAPAASVVLMRYPFPRAVAFPAGLTNSRGVAAVAATAQTDFDIRKNGTSVGTMRYAASATTATFIMASATSFAAGDVLTVVAPATPDATLADIGFALAGTR